MALNTADEILNSVLPEWQLLLQGWSADGSLVAGAQEALMLDEEPELLKELVIQWSAGDFSSLPPIELLPASSMPGAAGAYAISTGTIYINQAWLESASTDAVLSVLTQELGHHLDALLNSSDTAGDEGALFAALLENPDLSAEAIETYRTTDDSGTVYVDGQWIEVQTQFLENERYRRVWDTAADSLGNLFRASGGEDISNNNPDNNKSLVVDMIASDGSHKWDRIITGSQIDYLSIAITILPSDLGGGVALTYADGNQTIVKRLALDGSEYWTTSLSNPHNDKTRPGDIDISASGTVLLSGSSSSSRSPNSFFAVLSPDGEQKSFSLVSSQNLGLFVSTKGENISIVAGTDIGSFGSRSSFYQIIGDLGERIGDKSPLFPDYALDSTINDIVYNNGYMYATGMSGVKYPYVDDQEIPGYPGYPSGFITKISAVTGEREWTRLATFGDGPQTSGKDIFIMENGSIAVLFREELNINDFLVSYRQNGEVASTIDLQKSLRTAGIASKYFAPETHLSYSNGKFYYSYAAFDQDVNLVSNAFTSGTLIFSDSFAELNFGQASFSITGTRAVGQTLTAAVAAADPDGNGTFSHSWQASANGSTWANVGTNSSNYTIAAADEGKQLRLLVAYTDAQNFSETVTTTVGTIPFVDNGDGVIAAPSTAVESTGSIQLLKGSGNRYSVQGTTPGAMAVEIQKDGAQIYAGIYGNDWTVLAAETVNGVNQVLWKNTGANRLHVWSLDANWNWTASTGWDEPNSAAGQLLESQFGIDVDGNGTIASPDSTIDAAGATRLISSGSNRAYSAIANAAGSTPAPIVKDGTQIYAGIYGNDWTVLAAETVNGVNQVLWKNTAANRLHVWSLDANWNWTASTGWDEPNSAIGQQLEASFQRDLDDNGTIGDPITGLRQVAFSETGLIQSDRIYSLADPIGRRLANLSLTSYTNDDINKLGSFEFEFEFGPRQIISTLIIKGDNQPYPASYSGPTFAGRGQGDLAIRAVIDGSFTYADNKIASAEVTELASQTLQSTIGGSLGLIRRWKNDTSPAKVSNPDSLASLVDPFSVDQSGALATNVVELFYTDNLVIAGDLITDSGPADLVRSQLGTMGDGQFFGSGWQNNPFVPNLV